MLAAPCLALGQDEEPAQAPTPAPTSTVDEAPAPEAGEEATSPAQVDRTAELSTEIAKQKAEIGRLRSDLEHRLAEDHAALAQERLARQAVEAKVAEQTKAAVEAEMQRNPRVFGIGGLTLSGFLQADMYVKQSSEDQLDTSTGAPLNDDRFVLKRARLRASIDRRYLAAVAELDANTVNGLQARPAAMEATLKLPGPEVPYVAATVGIFKIPYGFEIGQSDHKRLFAERTSLARACFPGEYDLGARIAGGWRFVRYALAVQNGEPLGEKTFPGKDPNGAKDVVGRLGVESALGDHVYVQGGFSALTGKGLHPGTPPTKPTVTWKDLNEDGRVNGSTELIVSPGASGLPSMNFSRHAVGADALVSARTSGLGNTTVYGEITWAKNLDRALVVADPYGPLGRDLREKGYYLALVQDLGRFAQAGLRYDRYDPDQDSTDRVSSTIVLSSQAVSTFAVAVAARMAIGGLCNRLLLQYDINRNHFGRDQAGLPTNLASNAFTLRAEAVF
jgi:hypothetical protein